MQNLLETAPYLNAYQPAFLVVAVLAMVVLIQNFLTAPLAYAREEQVPGLPLRHDHSKLSFRAVRTYQNSAESFPAFIAATLVAVAGGAPPWVINGAAAIYLIARLAFWAIYYAGVGRVAGGPRTLAFVLCLLANIVIAGAAILAMV